MTSLFRRAKEKFDESQAKRKAAAEQAEAERQANFAARNAYSTAVMQLAQPGADVDAVISSLPDASAFRTTMEKQAVHDRAFVAIVEAMLQDDILDIQEETNLLKAADALGVTQQRLGTEYKHLLDRLVVAKVNGGRLPVLDADEVRLVLKTGEVAHLTTPATLYKWQAVRQYQGGSQGFSFRVMKGVYYHTGRTKGRSVVVGQNLVPDDDGVLTLTSRRAVFSGRKKSLEFDYRKLLDIELFSDGIRLAVSNRQTPSLMKFTATGDVVGAILTAAANGAS